MPAKVLESHPTPAPALRFSDADLKNLPPYNSRGWIGHKVTALPRALWSAAILSLVHLSLALIRLPYLFTGNPLRVRAQVYSAARDLQQALGWLITLFHHQTGQLFVQRALAHKRHYRALDLASMARPATTSHRAGDAIRASTQASPQPRTSSAKGAAAAQAPSRPTQATSLQEPAAQLGACSTRRAAPAQAIPPLQTPRPSSALSTASAAPAQATRAEELAAQPPSASSRAAAAAPSLNSPMGSGAIVRADPTSDIDFRAMRAQLCSSLAAMEAELPPQTPAVALRSYSQQRVDFSLSVEELVTSKEDEAIHTLLLLVEPLRERRVSLHLGKLVAQVKGRLNVDEEMQQASSTPREDAKAFLDLLKELPQDAREWLTLHHLFYQNLTSNENFHFKLAVLLQYALLPKESLPGLAFNERHKFISWDDSQSEILARYDFFNLRAGLDSLFAERLRRLFQEQPQLIPPHVECAGLKRSKTLGELAAIAPSADLSPLTFCSAEHSFDYLETLVFVSEESLRAYKKTLDPDGFNVFVSRLVAPDELKRRLSLFSLDELLAAIHNRKLPVEMLAYLSPTQVDELLARSDFDEAWIPFLFSEDDANTFESRLDQIGFERLLPLLYGDQTQAPLLELMRHLPLKHLASIDFNRLEPRYLSALFFEDATLQDASPTRVLANWMHLSIDQLLILINLVHPGNPRGYSLTRTLKKYLPEILERLKTATLTLDQLEHFLAVVPDEPLVTHFIHSLDYSLVRQVIETPISDEATQLLTTINQLRLRTPQGSREDAQDLSLELYHLRCQLQRLPTYRLLEALSDRQLIELALEWDLASLNSLKQLALANRLLQKPSADVTRLDLKQRAALYGAFFQGRSSNLRTLFRALEDNNSTSMYHHFIHQLPLDLWRSLSLQDLPLVCIIAWIDGSTYSPALNERFYQVQQQLSAVAIEDIPASHLIFVEPQRLNHEHVWAIASSNRTCAIALLTQLSRYQDGVTILREFLQAIPDTYSPAWQRLEQERQEEREAELEAFRASLASQASQAPADEQALTTAASALPTAAGSSDSKEPT